MNKADNTKYSPIRLLLVDDEDEFRQAVAKRLAKRGLVAEQAADGAECLSLLAQKTIDVVVLDVKMPGLSGIEVLRQIADKYPKTEVILLTGHATASDGVEGIKCGAFDYLTKPIELEHLFNKICQAYEKIQRLEAEQKEAQYRKQMEQQMIVTERLASLGTLAAGVAHEINNPLAIIKESAGWLRQLIEKDDFKKMPRKEDFAKALDKVEKSIERASRITHQLLGFVGKSETATTEISLKALTDETVQLVSYEIKKKGVQIVRKMDPSLDPIWSDAYQIRQVLLNLLTNAIHAVDSEGTITIAVEDAGDSQTITVSDTGPGIAREHLAKIFEPFFSTKAPDQGTGLGLFVSRGIVEKLGGSIEVASILGQGAHFSVRLPKHPKDTGDITTTGAESWVEKIRTHFSGTTGEKSS
jgi:C4-dicarboxylate-specific signal transduction histidine kinase